MSNQVQETEAREMVITGAVTNAPVGKILVVDDEPELRSVLVESLQSRSYEVVGCSSGRNALEELQRLDFDLLVTDLMMPEMDGISLLKAALEIDPHLVGIVVTGQGTIQTAVDAMQVGAFDYVLKPFRMQTLMPVLTRAMNVRRLKLENLQLRETVAIHGLCQTIAFTLDPQTVLSKLADAALQQTDADEVSILLPTIDAAELYVAAVRGQKRERLLGERVSLNESISSWVARERTPLILNGEVHDERFVALWPRADIRSAISVPMQVANRLVGIINLNVINRLRPFTLGQMKALTILASTAAAALESASLYSQVRTTEEKYRSIFENATEGLFQTTSDGRLLTANPAFARICGYDSPEEMIATLTDIAHQLYVKPEDRAEAARLQDLGDLVGFEMEAYRKNGERIWLRLNRRSVRDQTGKELYFEGSVEDITSRRQIEEEKRKTRQQYESLVQSIDGIVWELDLQTLTFTFVSKQCERLLGYTLEQWLSDRDFWTDHLHPDDRSWVIDFCLDAMAKRADHEFDYRMIAADGRVVWFRDIVTVDRTDIEHPHLRGVMVDITERKLVEVELKKSEERYRDLVENAHDLIYEHDLKGNYTATNKAGNRITGYSLEESLKLNLVQTVAPDYLEKAQEMLRRKLAGETDTVYDLVVIAKDGHRVPVEVNTRLVLKNGVPVGVQGIARDITARKRVEELQARRAAHALFRADVSAALARSQAPLQAALESCVTAMVEHLGAAFARVWTLNREEEMLELQASVGIYTHLDGPHSRVPVGSFKIGKIAQERAPHITNKVQNDPQVGDKEWARREGMVAFAGYPLLLENRVLGVMAMFSREELADDTLDALASVADLISQGIERKRAEEALRESEARKRAILESSMDCIITMDHQGLIVDWNPAAEKTFGHTPEEAIGKEMALLMIPLRFREQHRQGLAHYLATGKGRVLGQRLEVSAERSDGTEFPIELTITRIESKGAPMFTGYLRDITERKKAESRLAAQYAVTRALAESNTINEGASKILQAVCESLEWEYGSLWTVDRGSDVLRCSQIWQAPGTGADEFENDSHRLVFKRGIGLPGRVWNDSQPAWIADVAEDLNFPRAAVAAKVGLHGGCAFPIRLRSEVLGVVEFFSCAIREPDPELLAMMVTIGSQIGQFIERKRVEEALGESEEQLRQSQKLEAIGQLAGGVAHDFNNLLTAINGYSELALRRVGEEQPIASYLEEIKKAGDRAANLTRQLLAFGRKQLLQPLSLNLNDVVKDMSKMLRRLIGENIDFVAKLTPDLKQIKADPGQVEQVLVNLVVNARDAMPSGGTLTIETANAQLDGAYASKHVGVSPGNYVMLAVSDTGVGMDQETQVRIFDPFFTTKEKGKGTGLGLSTVYGIVRQSGGNVWVYSEPGRGTSFKIYLPQIEAEVEDDSTPALVRSIKRGSETVLLVEDEDMVRNLATELLKENGYNVLEASGGEEAIRLCHQHKEAIHLLITDVVMPKMSGKDVAHQLHLVHPETKVLFMSGYTDEAIVHHGIVDSNIAFIQKPFSETTLTHKIRDVLDAVNGQK